MVDWNVGSVIDEVGNRTDNIPSALSGTGMTNIINQRLEFINGFLDTSFSNTGITDVVYIEDALGNPVPLDTDIRGKTQITGIRDRWDYDGDLFTIGQETIYECTITDIKYNENNTATITAREY